LKSEPTVPAGPWPKAARWIRAQVRAQSGVRLHDLLIVSVSAASAIYLLLDGRWVPHVGQSIALFSIIALGLPVLRALARRWPKVRLFDLLASLWILPSAGMAHSAMQGLLDAAHPVLLDAMLARADLFLFHAFPAAWLDRFVGAWEMDLLLLSYYSYYIWPSALGLVLFFRKDRGPLEHYVVMLSLAYLVNFVFYLVVPAIGPRFYLLDAFHSGPLAGTFLTPVLDGLMRQPPFMRDCFPSGHTAVTLCVLAFAHRYARALFWPMLPVGLMLITATLAGRFHYGIDVLCAIPMAVAVVLASDSLAFESARPG
jgi:hypothetical protein